MDEESGGVNLRTSSDQQACLRTETASPITTLPGSNNIIIANPMTRIRNGLYVHIIDLVPHDHLDIVK